MSRIADLILRVGDAQGNRALARGQGRAAAIDAVAGFLPGVRARQMEDQDRQSRQRLLDSQLKTDELQRQNARGEIDDRAQRRMDEQETQLLAHRAQQVDQWLTSVASVPDSAAQQQMYLQGRQQLVQAGVVSENDFPSSYPGPGFIKGAMARLLPLKDRLAMMFPEPTTPKTREIRTRNADNSETVQIVEDTPGQKFSSAPPPAPPAPREPNPTEASLAAAAAAGDKSAAEALRLLRNQHPPQAPSTEPGWELQTATDPKTNQTQLVRVNKRTGEVQPVNLPSGMQPGGQRTPRLTAGQQEDLSTMKTVEDLIGVATQLGDKIGWKGVGALGIGTASKFAMNLGWGTQEQEALRNHISNIQATIAKLRGGTSFTVNEQKLLEQYTPTINDGDSTIKAKLASLAQFIDLKRKNTLLFAGADVGGDGPSGGGQADPLGIR